MKGLIRWPGVAAFFIIIAIVISFFALFLDNMVRAGLTAAFTRANQAEVNIEQVALHWSPFSVEIKNIQMTDPDMPSHNRFAARSLRAEVQFLELLIGKVHIEDLHVAGVELNSLRVQPGKVAEVAEPEDQVALRERLAEFNIELPTAKSFLEGANITTPALVQSAEQKFNERQQQFKTARENLPETEKFDQYRTRIDAIIESKPRKPRELIAAREQLNEIKQEIRADKARVETFLATSESIVQGTQDDLNAIKETYQADLNRARELFNFNTDSITELSGIMFGTQVEEWANYALLAFDFIAPLLENAKQTEEQAPSRWQGRYIDFDSERSPKFWVKQAQLSMHLQQLDFNLAIQNLTWQHERIHTPTEFQLTADQGSHWEQFGLSGNLFINNLGQVRGAQQWQLIGAELQNLELIGSSHLRTLLTQGMLNSEGSLSIHNGEIAGQGGFNFSHADFTVTGEGKVPEYLGQALSAIHTFNLNLDLAGQFTRPSFKLSSDLDRQLGAQFNSMLATEANSRLAEVRASLSANSQSFMSKAEPWLAQAEELRNQGKGLEESFTELLTAELDDLLESEGERLLDKLRNKRGNN